MIIQSLPRRKTRWVQTLDCFFEKDLLYQFKLQEAARLFFLSGRKQVSGMNGGERWEGMSEGGEEEGWWK